MTNAELLRVMYAEFSDAKRKFLEQHKDSSYDLLCGYQNAGCDIGRIIELRRDIERENAVPNVEKIWNRMSPKAKAEVLLRDRGCTLEKKEDHMGDTKSGWWQDTVFLGTDPVIALEAMNGDSQPDESNRNF